MISKPKYKTWWCLVALKSKTGISIYNIKNVEMSRSCTKIKTRHLHLNDICVFNSRICLVVAPSGAVFFDNVQSITNLDQNMGISCCYPQIFNLLWVPIFLLRLLISLFHCYVLYAILPKSMNLKIQNVYGLYKKNFETYT